MTNNLIETNMDAEEVTFEIDLINQVTGTTYPQTTVYGTNTLGQILNEYADDIGIRKEYKVLFENKRIEKTTYDRNETVEGLGLHDGDVLSVRDDCYPGVIPDPPTEKWMAIDKDCDNALKENRNNEVEVIRDGCIELLKIDLVNKYTGRNYPQILVYSINTLGQIAHEYAEYLGIRANSSKFEFLNRRTGVSTYNTDITVDEFGLRNGDVLSMGDNCGPFAVPLPTPTRRESVGHRSKL